MGQGPQPRDYLLVNDAVTQSNKNSCISRMEILSSRPTQKSWGVGGDDHEIGREGSGWVSMRMHART